MRIGILFLILCMVSACQDADVVEQKLQVGSELSVSEVVTLTEEKEKVTQPSVQVESSNALAKGEKVARKCMGCHSFSQGGANKAGPNLFAVWGRAKGSVEAFTYASYLQRALIQDEIWDEASLRAWLADSKKVAKAAGLKTRMPKQHIKGKKLDDLLAYLQGLR